MKPSRSALALQASAPRTDAMPPPTRLRAPERAPRFTSEHATDEADFEIVPHLEPAIEVPSHVELSGETRARPAGRPEAVSLDGVEVIEEDEDSSQRRVQTSLRGAPAVADDGDDDAETLRRELAKPSPPPKLGSMRPLPPPPPRLRTPLPNSAGLPPLPSSLPPPRTTSVRTGSQPSSPAPSLARPQASTPPSQRPRKSAPLVLDLDEKDFARGDVRRSAPRASAPRLETPQTMVAAVSDRSSGSEPPARARHGGRAVAGVGIVALVMAVGAGGFALGTGYQSRAVVTVVASEMVLDDEGATSESAPAPSVATTAPTAATTAPAATTTDTTTKPPNPLAIAPVATAVAPKPKVTAPEPTSDDTTASVTTPAPASPKPAKTAPPAAKPTPPSVDDSPYAADPAPKSAAPPSGVDPTHGVTSAGF